MRIIPVIDVLNGIVVRGVGGRRHEYRPIQSRLTASVDPAIVADALIDAFSPAELYVADLDAIQSADPCHPLRKPVTRRTNVWLDAGVRDAAGAQRVIESGCHVVAGLETVASPGALREMVQAVSPDRIVFSLDLKAGVPMRSWPGLVGPLAIAREAIRVGVRRMIVLDLARVGEGAGTGTEELCRQMSQEFPGLDLIAGGGLSGIDDLNRLAYAGVTAALVASALHDGRIVPIRNDYPRRHS